MRFDDEARRVTAGNRGLADPLHERECGSERLVGREVGSDDLDERKHWCRVEEVKADHSLRVGRHRRHLRYGQRRGVRCEHGVRPNDAVELTEERLLHREILDGRLDHEIARLECREIVRDRQPRERSVSLLHRQPALLDAAPHVPLDCRAAPFGELGGQFPSNGVDPGEDANLGDSRTHLPETDDPDSSDLTRRHLHNTRASLRRMVLIPRMADERDDMVDPGRVRAASGGRASRLDWSLQPGRLGTHRKLYKLARERDNRIRDLGGLTLEMVRREQLNPDLLSSQAGRILELERVVAEIESPPAGPVADEARSARAVPRSSAAAAGRSSRARRFCSHCGRPTALGPPDAPRAPGSW